MLIRFGTNGFTVSKHAPEEIGMKQDPLNPFTVEVRAKYFHILYIPFFATGNECALLFPNGNRYYVPDEYKSAAANLAAKGKTPWYSFSGLILIPLLIFGFSFFTNLSFRSNQNEYAEEIKTQNAADYKNAISQIENPAKGDFFTFRVKEGDVENLLMLRIDSSDAEKIYFSDKSISFSVYQDINFHRVAQLFDDTTVASSPLILEKKFLKSTLDKNGEEIFQPFADRKTIRFSSGWYDPGPELSHSLSPDLVSGVITKLNCRFYGSQGKIIKIIPKYNVKEMKTVCPVSASQFGDYDIHFIPGDESYADLGIVFQEEGSGKIYSYFARVFNGTVIFKSVPGN